MKKNRQKRDQHHHNRGLSRCVHEHHTNRLTSAVVCALPRSAISPSGSCSMKSGKSSIFTSSSDAISCRIQHVTDEGYFFLNVSNLGGYDIAAMDTRLELRHLTKRLHPLHRKTPQGRSLEGRRADSRFHRSQQRIVRQSDTHHLHRHGGLAGVSFRSLSRSVNNCPMGAINMQSPQNALRELLGYPQVRGFRRLRQA